MNTTTTGDLARTRLRRTVYAVMICAAVGMMLGRILAVDAVEFAGHPEGPNSAGHASGRKAKLQQQGVTGAKFDAAMAKEEERLREAFQTYPPVPQCKRP